jgi:glycosyltransferase involved in cell wall biosynthesis
LRIAFVIPNMGPGGAERVASLLSNDWMARNHVVDLIVFESDKIEPFHALDPDISVHCLRAKQGSSGIVSRASTNLKRIAELRSLLRRLRPEIAVSFLTEANVVALMAGRGLPCRVVISERNQPNRPGLGPTHHLARRLIYRRAAAIVMQTEDIAAWARARFRTQVHVIPNPVALDQGMHKQPANDRAGDTHRIVSIGRLTEQKGFDLLIESFASLAAKYPAWDLVIYGEGPQRPELTELIKRRQLEGRVALPGLTRKVAGALSEATLFVLPSRYEGFPNVLLEALSSGLPVIATQCPGASAEILAQGTYGKLVPAGDVPALTEALETLMTMPERRAAYAAKAREALGRYEIGKISGQWLALFKSIAAVPGTTRTD